LNRHAMVPAGFRQTSKPEGFSRDPAGGSFLILPCSWAWAVYMPITPALLKQRQLPATLDVCLSYPHPVEPKFQTTD
jgi:hypothetical protein